MHVDQDVSEQKLVLRMVAGLVSTCYDQLAMMIQQSNPLPTFEEARSRPFLEEERKANDLTTAGQLFLAPRDNPPPPPHQPP